MFIFAHNLMIGHAKPGCRKEPNFLKTTIERFNELLIIADEHSASLVLTGKSIATMRLEHWLNVLEKISDHDATIFVVVSSRPSEDLIALHNAGHLTLITNSTKRSFNQRGEISFMGNMLHFVYDETTFFYDAMLHEFHFADGLSVKQGNAIQVNQFTPGATLITKQLGSNFEHEQIEFDSESEFVLMDYVDAITVNTIATGDSKFIDALQRAEKGGAGKTIAEAISELKAPADVAGYLFELANQAETYDEYSQES